MKKLFTNFLVFVLVNLISMSVLKAQQSNNNYYQNNGDNGSAVGAIPDTPTDTPIDSNLYILLLAGLCYGYRDMIKNKTRAVNK